MGITTKSLEQLTPLDTTNSGDSSDDILPMMNKNHAHDQVDLIIEVDPTIDDNPTINVVVQAMQINSQGDIQERCGIQLWQPPICFGKWVFLAGKQNQTYNMATTKHCVPNGPLTIDKTIKSIKHKE